MSLPFIVGFVVVGLLQLAACVFFVRHSRAVARVESRIDSLVAAMSLLTDTAETGLRDVAQEINRLATPQAPKPRQRAATQRRITTAARRGRTVQQIAAAEGVSEGEISLRLQLAESTRLGSEIADPALA